MWIEADYEAGMLNFFFQDGCIINVNQNYFTIKNDYAWL